MEMGSGLNEVEMRGELALNNIKVKLSSELNRHIDVCVSPGRP
jgi:hypothetical protein